MSKHTTLVVFYFCLFSLSCLILGEAASRHHSKSSLLKQSLPESSWSGQWLDSSSEEAIGSVASDEIDEYKRAPAWGKRAPAWGKRAPAWGKRAEMKRAPAWGKRSYESGLDYVSTISLSNLRPP